MFINVYLKQVVFTFKAVIIKPLDLTDEEADIRIILTCGKFVKTIPHKTKGNLEKNYTKGIMLPFKCYLNCSLPGCHSVQRINVLKSILVNYEPIIFYPKFHIDEYVRIDVEICVPESLIQKKRIQA